MPKTELSVTLQNHTEGDIQVSIMGNPSDLSDISNQNTEYRYDITSLSFTTENSVSILYRRVGATDYSVFTAPLSQQTIPGVLAALNQLGIGSFFSFVSGANTYISNYNDDYEFGVLNIFNNAGSSTINLYWANNTLDNSTGSLVIDVNTVTQVNSSNGSGESGALMLAPGDAVDISASVALGETLLGFIVYRQPQTPSPPVQVLYSNFLTPGGSDFYSFTADAGFDYFVELGLP